MTAKKAITTDALENAVELTQKTANLTLKSAVQAVEATENYVQGVYKLGYDANLDALKVAKGYWDATTEIRKDWVKLLETNGEAFINAAAKAELPVQKELIAFGKGFYANLEKFLTPTKSTASAK